MHKIFVNFLNGETTLIDGLKEENPEMFNKLHDLWMIHTYFWTLLGLKIETKKGGILKAYRARIWT